MHSQIGTIEMDFYLQNLYWIIALGVLFLVSVYFLISRIHQSHQTKKGQGGAYLSALGGAENVLSHELVGSRIVVRLRDYSKVNKNQLEQAGIAGFIEKSDKLTLVIHAHADSVYRSIFPEE